MRVFSNFKELIDYVPNCIVCGKLMELHLKGSIKTESTLTSKWWALDHLHFRLKIKDEVLVGKCKKHSITINPIDNTIILGEDIINQLLLNWVTVYKKCYTCRCEVVTKFMGSVTNTVRNFKKFPPLTLTNEEIHFTRKRDKRISISQTYYNDTAMLGIRTMITISHRLVNPQYIDFNKFKNLDHLNERLSTILVFS